MTEKQIAGEKAVEFIKEGSVIGLGTGSTVQFTIVKLGKLVNDGFKIKTVSTSNVTTSLALSLKIPQLSINEIDKIDLTIDGADEVDSNLNGIKGGGGALLFEKIIASVSKEIIWVVDSSKLVKKLGKFPLPIEVVPFSYLRTLKKFKELNYNPKLRMNGNEIYITDGNHYIIDLHLNEINDPKKLNDELNNIPGVVENGLFIGLADKVIIGKKDSTEILTR